MTRVRAPGKVVLSGAYAVLAGAPAIATAVSRFVTVDSSRRAELVTPEVLAALGPGETAPWFDAAELREGGRKLGLGSSAAILVASVFALERQALPVVSDLEAQHRVFRRALLAHRSAQGGGSGVDVAASTFGGTLCYRLSPSGATWRPLKLPRGLQLELWTCPVSASTPDLLRAVAELANRAPNLHGQALAHQRLASEEAVRAADADDAAGFIAQLRAQQRALAELGQAAGVPIVTAELAACAPLAEREEGVLLPAGAGGGDIAFFAGLTGSTPALRSALESTAHRRLAVDLSAPGVGTA